MLSVKILKKLAEKLGTSEKTLKNNIAYLSKSFPQATSNARAQLFAQSKGMSVFRMLDKEDKRSLPTLTKVVEGTYNIKKYEARSQKQRWFEKEWLWAIVGVVIAMITLLISIWNRAV